MLGARLKMRSGLQCQETAERIGVKAVKLGKPRGWKWMGMTGSLAKRGMREAGEGAVMVQRSRGHTVDSSRGGEDKSRSGAGSCGDSRGRREAIRAQSDRRGSCGMGIGHRRGSRGSRGNGGRVVNSTDVGGG